MTLYHFCAAHMKDSVLEEGLTKGAYPIDLKGNLIPNIQWLTAEKDPDKQSWATRNLIPYSRTAYRLTVNIPDNYKKKLFLATDYIKRLPPECGRIVTDWPGSNVWYVYMGKIPAKWIVGCRKMEDTERAD